MEKTSFANLLDCAKYAFMPNYFGYCGPDKNQELFDYTVNSYSDGGLAQIINQFEVLFPYLKFIAQSNKIENPYDQKVIEAYWIGNQLLDNIKPLRFRQFFEDELELKKKLTKDKLNPLIEKVYGGGFPFHNFHVFNVWKRLGKVPVDKTLESMENCRISWGRVIAVDSPKSKVQSLPLVIENDQLKLGTPVEKEIRWKLEDQGFIDKLEIGDWVTIHWNWACEKIDPQRLKNLIYYTQKSLDFVNKKS